MSAASGTVGPTSAARASTAAARMLTWKHSLHREGHDHRRHEELIRGGVEDAAEDGAHVVLARNVTIDLDSPRISPSSSKCTRCVPLTQSVTPATNRSAVAVPSSPWSTKYPIAGQARIRETVSAFGIV